MNLLKSTVGMAILGGLIGFSACKEVPVILNDEIEGKDTTYVTSPESPQPKKLLATELTGVQCPNCPDGAALLESLNEQNNHSLITVSIHSGILTKPINSNGIVSKYDFRNDDGAAILNQIFGGDPNSKPSVAFNQLAISDNSSPYFIEAYAVNWPGKFQQALAMENPVLINLYVSSEYDAGNEVYKIKAKVAYNQSVSGHQRLHFYLVEDGILDVQQTANPDEPFKEAYVFNHTFRKSITGLAGQPILEDRATKEAGTVYEFTTYYKMEAPVGQDWNPDNMRVIAFVDQGGDPDIHVYQSAETPLK